MNQKITLFLCGDVMTGRGIDQVLPHPGDPRLYESYIRDARDYVKLAEQANGSIPKPVDFKYIWGEALDVLKEMQPDARIINLETSITTSSDFWKGKAVHYGMHPGNATCLNAAGIDCCTLANNHVLDWGYKGLSETLETLKKHRILSPGAGENLSQAAAPAIIERNGKGRIIIFSMGSETSGIPEEWAAADGKPGIYLLANDPKNDALAIKEQVNQIKQPGDVVIASIHWGGNWGYEITVDEQAFARLLIDEADVDLVHGHSSHHVKGMEVYHDKLILYGCGDFLSDYEGISGYEHFRDDLGLMYFPSLDPLSGKLLDLIMVPTQIRNFRVRRASPADTDWLKNVLNREDSHFGNGVELEKGKLVLKW